MASKVARLATLPVVAVMLRTAAVCFMEGALVAGVRLVKVFTDPFNEIKTYRMAPLHLLRGPLIAPMTDEQSGA
jgi:hypothetical protein